GRPDSNRRSRAPEARGHSNLARIPDLAPYESRERSTMVRLPFRHRAEVAERGPGGSRTLTSVSQHPVVSRIVFVCSRSWARLPEHLAGLEPAPRLWKSRTLPLRYKCLRQWAWRDSNPHRAG